MKTSELQGAALDRAVGKAMQLPAPYWHEGQCACFSKDWAYGGRLIEREGIEVCRLDDGEWRAQLNAKGCGPYCRHYGPTLLVAAMRCYVASRLGDEVEIPGP